MKQRKALSATIGLSFVLVAGLLVYGCDHHGGTGGGHEHEHAGRHGGETEQRDEEPEHHEGEQGHSEPQVSGKIVDGTRVVEMEARKYEFEPETVVVRSGEKVQLEVVSEDVEHGIGMDDYDIDREVGPEQTETIEFTAGDPGEHHFHCSVYCGPGHDQMHGKLIVLEAQDEGGDSE